MADPQQVLDLALPGNDAGAATVRGYLIRLLELAWQSGDGWHPFGNSGWQHDLYAPLSAAGLAAIGYDENGYATEGSQGTGYAEADALILAAIRVLGRPGSPDPAPTWLIRDRSGNTAIVTASAVARDDDGYLVLRRAGTEIPVAMFAPGGWEAVIAEPRDTPVAQSPWVTLPAEHGHG